MHVYDYVSSFLFFFGSQHARRFRCLFSQLALPCIKSSTGTRSTRLCCRVRLWQRLSLSLSWPLPCRPSASSCLEMQLRLHRVHIFLITILMRRVLCYTKRKNRIARSPAHTHLLTHTHSLHTLATRNTPLCQLADIDVARRRGTSSLDTQKTAAPSPLPSTTKN